MTGPRFPEPGTPIPRLVAPDLVLGKAAAEGKRLARLDRWSRAYVTAAALTPLLVRGTTNSRNYYIVEFRTSGRSTGRMIFNAATGKLAEIAGLLTGQESLPRFAIPSELPPLVNQREIQYAEGTIVKLLKERFSVDSNLVWTSCDQSHSPLQPFYVVRQPPHVAYVRVDGQVFPRLTTTGAGA